MRWNKVREHDNPEAYVIRVMVSKHADLRRKWARKRQEKEVSWELAESVLTIADQSDDVVQRLLVQSALKSLSSIQRAVLVLVYEHGLVLREVAEILHIPMGTAASHLARGKAAVAAHLELVPEFEKSIKKKSGLKTLVSGLHSMPDGVTPVQESYKLVMRSDVVRCLCGFSNVPIKAPISIAGSGSQTVTTTVAGEANGCLRPRLFSGL
jgi:RNA polymerase sigma factor (sigma-70 family)